MDESYLDSNMTDNDSAWLESVQGRSFDLSVLWQMLERQKDQMGEKEDARKNISTTWELVAVQVCHQYYSSFPHLATFAITTEEGFPSKLPVLDGQKPGNL